MRHPYRPNRFLVTIAMLAAALAGTSAMSLPESTLLKSTGGKANGDPKGTLGNPIAVDQIPAASSAGNLTTVDLSHVMLSTTGETRYLLTLRRQCPELRWARHVGITASGDSIWAGFDALTADGQTCHIQEIHRLDGKGRSSL